MEKAFCYQQFVILLELKCVSTRTRDTSIVFFIVAYSAVML